MGRLEEKAAQHELQAGVGLTAPELAWERAEALAPAEELEDLHRLCDLSQTLEPETREILEVLLRVWEIRETMINRSAPSLAYIFREKRDLVHRALLAASSDAAAAERAEWGRLRLRGRAEKLSAVLLRRSQAIGAGLEPLTDFDRGTRAVVAVLELVEAGDDAGFARAKELVTHHDPSEP